MLKDEKVREHCTTCLGHRYVVMAPSTCSAGGERVPCPACTPAITFSTPPAQAEASTLPGEVVCNHANSTRTGMMMLTMPRKHERSCPDCGAVFWAIPKNMGASFQVVDDAPPTTPAVESGERCRVAIDAGLRSFCRDEPDFTMSSGMRRLAADHILAQPGLSDTALRASEQDVERVSLAITKEIGWGAFDHFNPEDVRRLSRAALAALANHSPDAGGVGEGLRAWAYVHPETGERDFSWDRDTARAKRCRECGWTEIALRPALRASEQDVESGEEE